jgi:SAM-dependent methyltransferase
MSDRVVTSLPCNLCGAAEATVVGTRSRSGAALRSVCCVDCGLVRSDPRPLDSRRFYEHDYRVAYKGTFEPKLKHVLRAGKVALDRMTHVRPLLRQHSRVLDVGSGGGEFAHLLQTLGHEVVGVEPNRGYAEFSEAQYGIAVTRGFAGDVALPANHFDLITIWHVLEHTDDPSRVLEQLHSALLPGGSLVVEVPNIEATCQSPRSTFHEAHVFTFSPVTLRSLGEKAGLQVERITLSADGGNITAVLRRPSIPLAAPASLKTSGEHDRVVQILRAHRPLRHLLTPHPYRRLAGRVVRSLQERWQTLDPLPPRTLLHQLYSAPRLTAGSIAPKAPHGVMLWPMLIIASLIALALEWTLLDLDYVPLPPMQALAGYVAAGAVLVASVFVIARRSLTRQRGAFMAAWGMGVIALPAYC